MVALMRVGGAIWRFEEWAELGREAGRTGWTIPTPRRYWLGGALVKRLVVLRPRGLRSVRLDLGYEKTDPRLV